MKMIRSRAALSKKFRRVQTRFHERGQAAWEEYLRTGSSLSADEVLAKLQAKLETRRKHVRSSAVEC
jgi:hypothetical protein